MTDALKCRNGLGPTPGLQTASQSILDHGENVMRNAKQVESLLTMQWIYRLTSLSQGKRRKLEKTMQEAIILLRSSNEKLQEVGYHLSHPVFKVI